MTRDNDNPADDKNIERAEATYAIIRSYILHEDDLINQRTVWLMSFQAFLIATFGLSYQKKFEVLSNILTLGKQIYPAFCHFLVYYDAFLFALAFFGFVTSAIAVKSVGAAIKSIGKIQNEWQNPTSEYLKNIVYLCQHLPNMTGGGDAEASKDGIRFANALPIVCLWLWLAGGVFLVLSTHSDYVYVFRGHIDLSHWFEN